MRRRKLIALAGGAAFARPVATLAQQPQKTRRIALVHSGIPADKLTESGGTYWIRRFHEELRALGHREGTNLVIERFSAEGSSSRFAALASEVVGRAPEIIVTNLNPLVKAFMTATTTIPIVAIMSDPSAAGLVTSIARPGSNLTGVSVDTGVGIPAKRLQILKEAVPTAVRIAHLLGSRSEEERSGVTLVAMILVEVDEAHLRGAFAEMAQQNIDAALVSWTGTFLAQRALIVELAAQYRLPIIYPYRAYAEDGGLMAYAPELGELATRMANNVHQILGGAKSGDIPIYQPTKFELVINLATAKALGLTIPPLLLAQADEVIE